MTTVLNHDDPVVKEMDVIIHPNCSEFVHLFSYPLKSWNRPPLEPSVVKMRSKRGLFKTEYVMDVNSVNVNASDRTTSIARRRTFNSDDVPAKTSNMMGIIKNNQLHLIPIRSIQQLRPDMTHLDSVLESKKDKQLLDGVSSKVQVTYKRTGLEKLDASGRPIRPYSQLTEEEDPFVELSVNREGSPRARAVLSKLTSESPRVATADTIFSAEAADSDMMLGSSAATGAPKVTLREFLASSTYKPGGDALTGYGPMDMDTPLSAKTFSHVHPHIDAASLALQPPSISATAGMELSSKLALLLRRAGALSFPAIAAALPVSGAPPSLQATVDALGRIGLCLGGVWVLRSPLCIQDSAFGRETIRKVALKQRRAAAVNSLIRAREIALFMIHSDLSSSGSGRGFVCARSVSELSEVPYPTVLRLLDPFCRLVLPGSSVFCLKAPSDPVFCAKFPEKLAETTSYIDKAMVNLLQSLQLDALADPAGTGKNGPFEYLWTSPEFTPAKIFNLPTGGLSTPGTSLRIEGRFNLTEARARNLPLRAPFRPVPAIVSPSSSVTAVSSSSSAGALSVAVSTTSAASGTSRRKSSVDALPTEATAAAALVVAAPFPVQTAVSSETINRDTAHLEALLEAVLLNRGPSTAAYLASVLSEAVDELGGSVWKNRTESVKGNADAIAKVVLSHAARVAVLAPLPSFGQPLLVAKTCGNRLVDNYRRLTLSMLCACDYLHVDDIVEAVQEELGELTINANMIARVLKEFGVQKNVGGSNFWALKTNH